MTILRELARRKLRTSLTIIGITIGIVTLVVFSSMANKINAIVEGGSRFYVGKIIVSDASKVGIGLDVIPIDLGVADQIRELDGVAAVDPQIRLPFDDVSGAAFGTPNIITGAVGGADGGMDLFTLTPAQGRLLAPEDEGTRVTVLGSHLASRTGAAIGDTIRMRGVSFEVIGILEPTLISPDTTAMVPLAAAQDLFFETLPPLLRQALDARRVASQIIVYPTTGTGEAALAAAIEAAADSVSTLTAADFDEQVGSTTTIFNAIIIGVAAISLVVGGLSVINTMAMSVAERTREIGIKRAIGGPRGRIIRELVAEAGVIGLIGGLLGLAVGAIVVVLANELGRTSGTVLFDLDAQTALFALAFGTILGMVAGVVPAWSAARLDPVTALRYE